MQTVRMLAVMALVDGRIDAAKTALVAEYAHALRVDEGYLHVLAETAQGEIAAATACMIRRNAATFPPGSTRPASTSTRSHRSCRTATGTTTRT